jgi:hypothetical protein
MALVITLINTLSIFIILPVAMLVYFAAATLLGTIPRDDLQAIYGEIRRKANRASSDHAVEQPGLDLEPHTQEEEIVTMRLPRVYLPMPEHLPQRILQEEEIVTMRIPRVNLPMPEHLPQRILQEEEEQTVKVPRMKNGIASGARQ